MLAPRELLQPRWRAPGGHQELKSQATAQTQGQRASPACPVVGGFGRGGGQGQGHSVSVAVGTFHLLH